MARVIQARCPSCQHTLRIPADWLQQTLRCKKCGVVVRAQARVSVATPPAVPNHAPAPVAAPLPAVAAAPVPYPATNGAGHGPAAPMPLIPMPAAPMPAAPMPLPAAYPMPQGQAFLPVAPGYASAPVPQPPSSADIGFTPAFLPGGAAGSSRSSYRKQGMSTGKKAVLGLFGLLLVSGLAVGGVYLAKPDLFGGKPDTAADAGDKQESGETSGLLAHSTGDFPRRMLAISVNNYLYANPMHYGSNERDIAAIMRRLQERWRIPKSQTYLITDGATGDANHPPLKGIMESAIDQFLTTCRAQDRILLIYTGHAVEIDGEGFIAPMEAELEDKKTLISLKWVFDKLAACKAQQKVLILDVCRFDPGRGTERPSSGPMSEKLDKFLASPPPGVQVWTSCTAGQHSYEYDYATHENREIWGSVFLSQFWWASQKGSIKGIQRADDPLPLGPLTETVNAQTVKVVGDLQKTKQTPRLSGSEPDTRVAANPNEPMPPRLNLPTPATLAGDKGVADRKFIRNLLAEIEVPSIKIARKDTPETRFDTFFPFREDVMNAYKDDVPLKDIEANPDKYPLRVATLNAVKLLRKIREKKDGKADTLPEEFRGETDDKAKEAILNIQRTPAEFQLLLEEELAKMEEVAEKRDEETSKRWRANFDYVHAQLKMRYAYIHEYNLMLGKVRKNELPALDPKLGHKGWRLASVPKMQSAKEVRELESEARKLMAQLAKEHPNTPYAVLAKRERSTALGLQWQATAFGE